jgi:hypothetical protein
LVRWANLILRKEIKQATPSSIRPQTNLILQREFKQATPSLVGPQAGSFPQIEIKQATPSSARPQAIEQATPSLVWPQANLILTLQNIMATPCPHLLKPLFKFNLSVKAAEKNFILLKHKFGGNLHLALHAQNGLPLSYGVKFKLALMLESIFKFHPSWQKIKTVLTKGSEWPLSTLDNSKQLKDIDDAFKFGNHKGANQQEELLLKLVKDDVVRGLCTSPPT